LGTPGIPHGTANSKNSHASHARDSYLSSIMRTGTLWLGLVLLAGFLPSATATDGIFAVKSSADYQKVMDSGAAWILGLLDTEHAPESEGHTEGMLAELSERLVDYGVMFASLDCGQKSLKKICRGIPPRKTIPGVAFVIEPPQFNPYTKKMIRNMVVFDGNPSDVKSVERRFSKSFPASAGVAFGMGEEEGSLPTGEERIMIFSPRDAVNLFTKTVCNAFPTIRCIQLGKTVLAQPEMQDVVKAMQIETQDGSMVYTVGHMAADGSFAVYVPSGTEGAQKERIGVLGFLQEKTGLTAEAGASGKDTGKGSAGQDTDKSDKQKHNGQEILELSAENFSGEAMLPGVAWVVRVAASGFASNEANAKAWKGAMGATCEGRVMPMHLTCPEDLAGLDSFGAQLCRRRALPFVAVVPYSSGSGSGSSSGSSSSSSSSRKSADDLKTFEISDKDGIKKSVLGSFPEDVVALISEQDVEGILQRGSAQNKLTVIVLSDKEDPPNMLRNVAVALDKFALVSFMSEPSAQFLARIGSVKKLPAVLVGSPQPLDAPDRVEGGITILQYDPAVFGPIRFQGLQNFILAAYQRSGLHSESEEGKAAFEDAEAAPMADVSGAVQTELTRVTTAGEWAAQCGSGYKGLCAVGLLGHDDSDVSAAAGVLTRAMHRLGKQAALFRFLLVDGNCQATFAGRFDVQVDTLPRVVVYSPSKRRYMSLTGTMDEESVGAFLQSAATGKTPSTSIPQSPEFSAECEYVAPQEAGAEDGLAAEDMDDLMEEIRREEAAAAAVRKKAAKEEEARAKKAAAEAAKKPKTIRRVVKKKKSKASKASKEEEDEL